MFFLLCLSFLTSSFCRSLLLHLSVCTFSSFCLYVFSASYLDDFVRFSISVPSFYLSFLFFLSISKFSALLSSVSPYLFFISVYHFCSSCLPVLFFTLSINPFLTLYVLVSVNMVISFLLLVFSVPSFYLSIHMYRSFSFLSITITLSFLKSFSFSIWPYLSFYLFLLSFCFPFPFSSFTLFCFVFLFTYSSCFFSRIYFHLLLIIFL